MDSRKLLSNDNMITLLTIYAAGLFVNNCFGYGWYIKSSSMVDELFYFGVSLLLAAKHVLQPRNMQRKRYHVMLSVNISLALIGIYDSLIVFGIKSNYMFKDKSAFEFGEVEMLIDQYDGYLACNYFVWVAVIGIAVGVLLSYATRRISETSE